MFSLKILARKGFKQTVLEEGRVPRGYFVFDGFVLS